jgi:hypothetical protein
MAARKSLPFRAATKRESQHCRKKSHIFGHLAGK